MQPSTVRRHLVWFRQDLRLADNTALSRACDDPAAQVCGVFIATPRQWQQHDMAPLRQRFLLRHVRSLQQSLAAIQIPLLYVEVPLFADVAPALASLVAQHGFTALYANREYGWNEKERDARVDRQLQSLGCQLHLFHDQAMLAPGLQTRAGKPYSVYTPFRKRWLQSWRSLRPAPQKLPQLRQNSCNIAPSSLPPLPTAASDHHWPAGEPAAASRLEQFCQSRIFDYHRDRDIPSLPGTSTLSPWLAAGVLSPRQCLERALAANQGRLSGGQEGVDSWIGELIWRDFYIHILDSFPAVSQHRPFKAYTASIAWRHAEADFKAWCEGRTGIPIVDAAMRQLLQTGWMHNRLRMVVAMFLSKQLLIDWRRGERFFMRHLIDCHLAANNGGWQWAASTGTDAAPYFRLFNPVTQSRRFDPCGRFIRQFVPELVAVGDRDIHLPPPLLRQAQAPDYPEPIIDLKLGRQRALDAFASARSGYGLKA